MKIIFIQAYVLIVYVMCVSLQVKAQETYQPATVISPSPNAASL
jgi:hypothetical protein